MKKLLFILFYFCLACPCVYAQAEPPVLKVLYITHPRSEMEYMIEAGDKLLLAYHVDYCAQNPHQNTAKKKYRKRKKEGILYGKERVLRILDDGLIFMNGTYASFESIAGIHKLSFTKQLGRGLARVAASVMMLSFPIGTILGVCIIIENNDRIAGKHIVPWTMRVE